MDEGLRKAIDNRYDEISNQLKGGRLYGIPINTTDAKMMVVAAFTIGQTGEMERNSHRQEKLIALLN